jgi:hypothetical protein
MIQYKNECSWLDIYYRERVNSFWNRDLIPVFFAFSMFSVDENEKWSR